MQHVSSNRKRRNDFGTALLWNNINNNKCNSVQAPAPIFTLLGDGFDHPLIILPWVQTRADIPLCTTAINCHPINRPMSVNHNPLRRLQLPVTRMPRVSRLIATWSDYFMNMSSCSSGYAPSVKLQPEDVPQQNQSALQCTRLIFIELDLSFY